MNRSVVVARLALLTLLVAEPASARDPDPCDGSSCGKPNCEVWAPVAVRPERVRVASTQCLNTTGARLIRGPEHGEITNVSTDWSRLKFTIRMDADAPGTDEAVFEVQGYTRPIELTVPLRVVPLSVNSAPICEGDRATKRSDGTGPVDLFMHPWCRDPDGDEFTVYGGGPGTHPLSPKEIPAGESDPNWPYRTATFSGDERSAVWAIDSLGARSSDAYLDVTVGPAVDLPPECRPNPAMWPGPMPIYTRPGAIRRFAIICEDADHDDFTPAVSTPPSNGVFAGFDIAGPSDWAMGRERWIDATYVPTGTSTEPDTFGITATGPRGAGPEGLMQMVPRPLPANGGAGCGWSPGSIETNTPGTIQLTCNDDDGDPLEAEIVRNPDHGLATPATVTPGLYGGAQITIPYVPEPGYKGYDCVEVKISDGNGWEFTIAVDIFVDDKPVFAPPPPGGWPLPPLPPPNLPFPPAGGPNAPVILSSSPNDAKRIRSTRATARAALGTTAVKRIKAAPGFDVWARSSVSRSDLKKFGRAPGVVAVCVTSCEIRSSAGLRGTKAASRRQRRQTAVSGQPGEAQVVTLTLAKAEIRALRKMRKPTATFDLSVKASSGRAAKVSRAIPVR